MPKVIGPALSIDARGKLGSKITFQGRPSGSAVYPYSKPGLRVKKNVVPSASQSIMRNYYYEAVGKWRQLNPAQKGEWNDFVKEN